MFFLSWCESRWRVFSFRILSDRSSEHQKPFFFFSSYRMTQCVCSRCCCWTRWCCYWLDKSRRSDSGRCLPWFSFSWWVDMMQREACSARSPYCLPLSILSPRLPVWNHVFLFLSQWLLFFFLSCLCQCSCLNHLSGSLFFLSPVLSLPPSLYGRLNGVSVIKSSGLLCECVGGV